MAEQLAGWLSRATRAVDQYGRPVPTRDFSKQGGGWVMIDEKQPSDKELAEAFTVVSEGDELEGDHEIQVKFANSEEFHSLISEICTTENNYYAHMGMAVGWGFRLGYQVHREILERRREILEGD